MDKIISRGGGRGKAPSLPLHRKIPGYTHNMYIPTMDLLSGPNAHRQDDSVGRVNWASPHRDSPYAPNNPTWANLLKSVQQLQPTQQGKINHLKFMQKLATVIT